VHDDILSTINKKFGKCLFNKKAKPLFVSKGCDKPLYKDIVKVAETLGVIQYGEKRTQPKGGNKRQRNINISITEGYKSMSKERAKTAKGFFRKERSKSINLGLDLNRTPFFKNEVVSGIKIKGFSQLYNTTMNRTVNVTAKTRKHIILSMLEQGKIPLEIVPKHKVLISNPSNEKEKWNKLSDLILKSYDMVIQASDVKKHITPKINSLNEDKCLLSVKSISMSRSTINKPISISFIRPHKKSFKKEKKVQEIFKLPEDIKKSPINITINLINKYSSLAFNKSLQYSDLKHINALHKKLGLGRAIQNEEELKSYEKICQLKERLLRALYMVLNRENGYVCENITARFYIERGNNSGLVRSLLRERYWWISLEDPHKQPNLLWSPWKKMSFIASLGTVEKPLGTVRISNHLEGNYYLGHKKYMYKCLLLYYSLIGKDISQVIPLTFHIKNGKRDSEYRKFIEAYNKHNKDTKNIWIVKPGENTNQGNGITITSAVTDINRVISNTSYTYIIQRYIEKPLLFERRKFDIRCFALLTSINGLIKAYYYQEGYLRTSSQEYSVSSLSKSIHLTNEAVQIMYNSFGKHEAGNKVSYTEFQTYLDNTTKPTMPKINFFKDILPTIKVVHQITAIEYNDRDNKISVFICR